MAGGDCQASAVPGSSPTLIGSCNLLASLLRYTQVEDGQQLYPITLKGSGTSDGVAFHDLHQLMLAAELCWTARSGLWTRNTSGFLSVPSYGL